MPVTTQTELERQRDTHQEGEAFTLSIEREGFRKTFNARFKQCTAEERKEKREGRTYNTDITLSADRSCASHRVERDPCAMFIGVYATETGNEQGVRVTGVIGETPAELGGVQPGDIITAVDGSTIPNHQQLRVERNKHEPGDDFRLTVLRDGVAITIEATFNACDDNEPSAKEEKVSILEEQSPVQENDPALQQQNQLELTDFNAYTTVWKPHMTSPLA